MQELVPDILFDLLTSVTMDVPLGVVGVDEKENIRVLNLVAWSLLRNNRLYALGRSVKEVHPENGFSQVRGAKESSIDQVKILVGGAQQFPAEPENSRVKFFRNPFRGS